MTHASKGRLVLVTLAALLTFLATAPACPVGDPKQIRSYFREDIDPNGALTQVNSLASAAMPKLPPGTLPPVILPFDPTGTTLEGPARRVLKVPGTVVAAEEARLFARITGYVQKVQADIGDRVKKGQLLAELAVPEMEAELTQKKALVVQANAEVQQAQALLQQAKAALTTVTAQVQAAEAAVNVAQAQFKFSERQYERMKELFKKGAVNEKLVEEAAAKVEAARAALVEAESKLRVAQAAREEATARNATAEAGVKVAQTRREVAKADLERVAVQLQYARIVAPFDGVVTQRSVSRGELAGPPRGRAAPLFVVSRVDTVRVVVTVPEVDAARLRPGVATASVQVDALPGQVFKGKVVRTAGALDPAKRTLRAEIDLPNRDGKLLPGMYGTVTITLSQE